MRCRSFSRRGQRPRGAFVQLLDVSKDGYLHVIVPPDCFAILSGEAALQVYTFNTHVAKHMFCKICGIHPFYRPRSHPDCWDVNVLCLDGDTPSRFRVEVFDGENWELSAEATRK